MTALCNGIDTLLAGFLHVFFIHSASSSSCTSAYFYCFVCLFVCCVALLYSTLLCLFVFFPYLVGGGFFSFFLALLMTLCYFSRYFGPMLLCHVLWCVLWCYQRRFTKMFTILWATWCHPFPSISLSLSLSLSLLNSTHFIPTCLVVLALLICNLGGVVGRSNH